MAAGLMVVIGSLLTFTLSPSFIIIPLCIGAGLFFAGLTNTCGMAMILAKAPWNKNA
jgi:hypothetical protein